MNKLKSFLTKLKSISEKNPDKSTFLNKFINELRISQLKKYDRRDYGGYQPIDRVDDGGNPPIKPKSLYIKIPPRPFIRIDPDKTTYPGNPDIEFDNWIYDKKPEFFKRIENEHDSEWIERMMKISFRTGYMKNSS